VGRIACSRKDLHMTDDFVGLDACVRSVAERYATTSRKGLNTRVLDADDPRMFEIIWVDPGFILSDPRGVKSTRHHMPSLQSGKQEGIQRYLFRGEAALYASTKATGSRLLLGQEPLTLAEAISIIDVSTTTMSRLQGLQMSELFAEACCQHYGLSTTLVDFTSNLRVAARFASSKGGRRGRIGVLDLAKALTEEAGVVVADLTGHSRARRVRAGSEGGAPPGVAYTPRRVFSEGRQMPWPSSCALEVVDRPHPYGGCNGGNLGSRANALALAVVQGGRLTRRQHRAPASRRRFRR
jgi:hypothetical protein